MIDLATRWWLDAVATTGFVHIPEVLSDESVGALLAACEAIPLIPAAEQVGAVIQRYDGADFDMGSAPPEFVQAATDLRRSCGAGAPELEGELERWPTEFAVSRFEEGGLLSRHRDHARYRLFIVVLSLSGVARLETFASVDAEQPKNVIEVRGGDLTVFAAGSFGPRVQHSVTVVSPPRTTLAFRMI